MTTTCAIKAVAPPTVRLAYSIASAAENCLIEVANDKRTPTRTPALLVSYYYVRQFLKKRHLYRFRDWVMDSGAFSAFKSGVKIELTEYIEFCKRLQLEDKRLVEVFAMDVIGDWRASMKNTETMWKHGVNAIPCYHAGEPEDVLIGMARDYDKIAIGGVALVRGSRKLEWARQCFARVWPKKIHGFGFGSKDQILALPWHSVDATSWELGPLGFGRWNTYGKMSVRGSNQKLMEEVDFYLDVETLARHKWRDQMRLL